MVARLLLLGWVGCAALAWCRTPAEVRPDPPAIRADRHGDLLPPGALLRLGTIRLRYPGTLACLAFSPDGKFLATGGDVGVRLWDADTGRPVRRLAGSRDQISLLAFSADGKQLATASSGEFSAHWAVWDTATGAVRQSGNTAEPRIAALAFSPDGQALALGGAERNTDLMPVGAAGGPRQFGGPAAVLAFSADGKRLAVVRRSNPGSTLQLWEPAADKRSSTLQVPDSCCALAFSADGQLLFAASPGEVWVLDGTTGKTMTKHPLGRGTRQTRPGRFADVAAEGKGTVAAIQGETLILWDGASGKSRECAQIPSAMIPLVAVSRDGKRVAVAHGKTGLVRLFDAATGQERTAIAEPAGHIHTLGFTPDGKALLTFGTDRRLTVWDLPTGTKREAFGSGEVLDGAAFTHFGGRLATAAYPDGERKIVFRTWDLRSAKMLHEREVDELGVPTFLAVAPDGNSVSARQRGVCRLWDLKAGERADPEGLPTTLADIAFADDGRSLILGGRGDRLVVFDGPRRRARYTILEERAAATRFALSPNGRVLGVSFGNGPAVAALYDFHSGELIRELGRRRDRAAPADEAEMVARRMSRMPGQRGEGPSPVAFSPDGRCVAAADDAGVLHVWRIDTGEELNKFAAGDLVGAVAFRPDGQRLACAVAASVLVWDVSANAGQYAKQADSLSAERLEHLWSDLASREGIRAVRAVWELADAPGPAVSFLAKRLHPLSLDAKRIEQWITDLQDRRYATRSRAQDELAKLDEAARPWLEKHLENSPSVETRRRLELLLQPLDGALPSAEKMRLLRAVEVLQHVGTPEACRVLERLAGGDAGAWLTGHARAVRNRLRKNGSRQ